MRRLKIKIPVFLQAVLVVAAAYLIFKYAFPPLMPKALTIQFMIITVIGVLLYFSYDDDRWEAFKRPVRAVLGDDRMWAVRWGLLLLIPGLIAYNIYDVIKPSAEAPVELRQVHPAPPSTLRVYNKTYNLTTLENPVRAKILMQLKANPEQAWDTYNGTVQEGERIYSRNCQYCHGDLLNGQGIYANGFNPVPANFRDVGTIAQLQEAYLFWRITTGGPGLPREGTPWNSAMPVWHEMLSEEEVWQVITFLYDRVGQVPRMWDPDVSKSVANMNNQIQQKYANLSGNELYQFHCAVCHGEKGAGDGPAAKFLYPKPRNFTIGLYKYKTTPFDVSQPTDDDLLKTIREGLPGTAMPAWKTLLSDEQIHSLIPVVKGLDTVGIWAPEDASDKDFDEEGYYQGDALSFTEHAGIDNQIPFSDESVTKGRQLFVDTCAQCHGEQGHGNPAVDKRLKDEWGDRIWPRDLAKPWTWRFTEAADNAEQTIRNIFVRLSVGIPGTPMKPHADTVDEEERWHIANYVYTLRNTHPPLSDQPFIQGSRIDAPLPDTVDDPQWDLTASTTLRLVPNIIKEQRLFKPLNDAITLRVLYNDTDIAFLLELDDRTYSRPGDPDAEQTQDKALELHPDAFAIQLPYDDAFSTTPVVEKPMFRHGDGKHPTTIWYWNAGSVEPQVAPQTMILDARGVDKKLQPRAGDNSVTTAAEWISGRWRILMKRARDPDNSKDIRFTEGRYIPVSFANWDGSNGEIGSRHTLSSWYWLLLPTRVNKTYVYGLPSGIGLVVFLAGLVLIRSQRPKK